MSNKRKWTIENLQEFQELYKQQSNLDAVLILSLIDELILYKKVVNEFNGGRRIYGSKANRKDYVTPISTEDIYKIQELAEDTYFKGGMKLNHRLTGEIVLDTTKSESESGE